MLVKQRDNEIGILLNYLNKQKESGGDASVPVETSMAVNSTQYSNNVEENNRDSAAAAGGNKQTLFQMMNGSRSGAANPSAAANKSIKEKRMDFELNQ